MYLRFYYFTFFYFISFYYSQIMMKTKSKKEREKRKEIILEGRRLIIDALKANVVMKALYFSKTELLENFPSKSINFPVFKLPYKHFKLWTDTETPQGILGNFTSFNGIIKRPR